MVRNDLSQYRYGYFTIFEGRFLPNLNKNLFKLLKILRFYDLYVFIENKLLQLLLIQLQLHSHHEYDIIITVTR